MRIVDSGNQHGLVAHGSSNNNSSGSNNSNSSTSTSGDSKSWGPSGAHLDNGAQDVSGASLLSANEPHFSSSLGSNAQTPLQSKKCSCVASHSGKVVVDVDIMSSDACAVCMLSDGDYIVHP